MASQRAMKGIERFGLEMMAVNLRDRTAGAGFSVCWGATPCNEAAESQANFARPPSKRRSTRALGFRIWP